MGTRPATVALRPLYSVASESSRSGPVEPIRRGKEPGSFDGIHVWIFDLDNTLYPSACNLFAAIDRRMGDYIARLLGVPLVYARHLQKAYYNQFGTTLNGLIRVHGVEPEAFLDYVHDIDLSSVERDSVLAAALAALPGRRFIYTNGSRRHAERVAEKLGVLSHFDSIIDIAACGYVPKPVKEALSALCARHGIAPGSAAMFDDMPRNLETAAALGMTAVLVTSCYRYHRAEFERAHAAVLPPYIHHRTDSLTTFLQAEVRRRRPGLPPVISA